MDFLDKIKLYRTTLEKQRKLLIHDISIIDARLADCEAAERLEQSLGDEIDAPKPALGAGTQSPKIEPFDGNRTELAVAILKRTYPAGLKLSHIQEIAQKRYSIALNANSTSVSLARLKGTGDIKLEGKFWFYVPENQRQQKTGASADTDAPENAP